MGAQADRLWADNLEKEDSPLMELFAGQLQGNIVCHKCKSRFTKCAPPRPAPLELTDQHSALQ